MRRIRRLWAGIALCAATVTLPVPAVRGAPAPPTVAQILQGVTPAAAELVEPGPDPAPPPLPADPGAALASAVTRLSSRLGVPLDPGPALSRADLDPALAGRLALLLGTLGACMDASDRLVAAMPVEPGRLLDDRVAAGVTLPAAAVAAVRGCALRLERGGLELKRFLAGAPHELSGSLHLWPVLRLDNTGTDHVVLNDYLLSVDRGGNDRYYNNAGGNLVDVRRGPPGSQAPVIAPARGCVNPVYDLHEGQCVIAAALLLDMAGDDTYGRVEPPAPNADGWCTNDPLVQRIMTEGAGFAGVGVLVDAAGNDTYVGKTMTQGAGHAGGVGILRDEQGDDLYTAIRMAKGIGVLQGTGILHDLAGSDRYTFSLPRARVPGTPDGRPGAGFFNGVGVFVDAAGHDTYSGMPGRDNGGVAPPGGGSTGVFMDLQ